jgi:phosphate transport system substrate-binding protein
MMHRTMARASMATAILPCCFAALLFVQGCGRGSGSGQGGALGGASRTIQIKGSDTMVNLGQAWAEAFMEKHPGVSMAVTGGGSGTGIAALINGTTDIAQSSRSIKSDEVAQASAGGHRVYETQVAIDGLTVAVNPSNPISQLTLPQLSQIFAGRLTDWSQVGGKPGKIVLLSRERNSGTHVFFLEHVVRLGDSKSKAEYAATALMMPSSQAIADEISQNPGAIGYFGHGYLQPNRQKALKIAVKAGGPFVTPSIETSASGAYPISRPLFLYTPGAPSGVVKQYIDWVQGPEGQKVVRENEFVPLTSPAPPKPLG